MNVLLGNGKAFVTGGLITSVMRNSQVSRRPGCRARRYAGAVAK